MSFFLSAVFLHGNASTRRLFKHVRWYVCCQVCNEEFKSRIIIYWQKQTCFNFGRSVQVQFMKVNIFLANLIVDQMIDYDGSDYWCATTVSKIHGSDYQARMA